MDLSAELAASNLSASAEAVSSIDAGWVLSGFNRVDSVDEFSRIYALRLKHIQGIPGAHARQLEKSTHELVEGLREASSVQVGTLSGNGEHHFLVVRDPLREKIVGVLRVVGKLDVTSERWEELWSQ